MLFLYRISALPVLPCFWFKPACQAFLLVLWTTPKITFLLSTSHFLLFVTKNATSTAILQIYISSNVFLIFHSIFVILRFNQVYQHVLCVICHWCVLRGFCNTRITKILIYFFCYLYYIFNIFWIPVDMRSDLELYLFILVLK